MKYYKFLELNQIYYKQYFSKHANITTTERREGITWSLLQKQIINNLKKNFFCKNQIFFLRCFLEFQNEL